MFDKWGGIPRYVLAHARDPRQQRRLRSAVKSVNLNILVRAVGSPEAQNEATRHLIHIHVTDDFDPDHLLLASENIANLVYTHLYETDRAQLIQFLKF